MEPAMEPAMEPQFPPQYFLREDEDDDGLFYTYPRKLVHIDDGAIATVGKLFRDFIPADSEVLDLMSSWRSHWPEGHPKRRMVGLGLNAEEMADNPDLDEYVVHNVNQDPELPFSDEAFDAAQTDISTLTFGPSEARPARGFKYLDVDEDGDIDLVLNFHVQKTGISLGDTELCLSGETLGGVPIVG